MKKKLKVLCISLIITLFFTTSAVAYSHNNISRITSIQNNGEYFSIGEIRISEDKDLNNDFQNGDVFTISLPAGIAWNRDSVVDATYADVKQISDRTLELTMKNCVDGVTDSIVLKGLQIKADKSFVGDIRLEIDGKDSAVTSTKSISQVETPKKQYYNEIVTVLKVFDDYSALIGRENGEQHIIEIEVPLGLWTMQRKTVVVLSPGALFAGPGAYLQVPSGNKSLIIDAIQLNSKVTDTSHIKSNSLQVFVEGEQVSFDTEPIIDAGVTLVPLRVIMEKLGAEVAYDGEMGTITVSKEDKNISLKVGESKAKVNESTINLQVPAQIVNSRTLVPLRFISESLGAKVEYDELERTIYIY